MNTRKDNNGVVMKKWLNTPRGHIAKPLWAACHLRDDVYRLAKQGNGLELQKIARKEMESRLCDIADS